MLNHLKITEGKLKGVKFVDTPRDQSEPVKITAVQYSELLTLINDQMKENARLHSSFAWFKAMAFWGFFVSLALCFVVKW